MPIVINEITISVDVTPPAGTAASTSASASDAFSREDIVQECVEKVLEIINQKNER